MFLRGYASAAGARTAADATLRPEREVPHTYTVYAGVGWATGRPPRPLWRKATASTSDPLPRRLVLDGHCFHQPYVKTRRYVDEQYLPQVAQGSAFAAAARAQTGLVSAHTEPATEVLCAATPEEVARVCMGSVPAVGATGLATEPPYEVSRQNIAAGPAALQQTNT